MKRRVFLQLEDANYNTNRNRYELDFREYDIRNPISIGVVSSTIEVSTDTPYLLISSKSLASMNKEQTIAQTNGGFTDLVYCLQPENNIIRTGTTSTQTTTGISDNIISALGDKLLWWWDFHKTRLLDSTFQEVDTIGDNVQYYYNRTPASQNLLFQTAYGQGLLLSVVGSTRGVSKSGSWESAVDSTSTNNPCPTDEFSFHHLWTAPAIIGTGSTLVNMHSSGQKILNIYINNGGISFKNAADSWVATNLSWVPLRTYIISVSRTSAAQLFTFEWRLEDLTSGTVQTDSSVCGAAVPSNQLMAYQIGYASMHFEHTASCIVLHNGVLQADTDASVQWLNAQYSGNSEVTVTEQQETKTYQLFSRQREVFQCKTNCPAILELDFQFRNSTGTVIKPKHGLVELEILS